MNKYETWFGVAVKGGGTIGVSGLEYMTGEFINVGQLSEWHGFQMISLRLGLGLGAGAGLTACFVFNCMNLMSLHETFSTDWGVNISLGGKWSEVAKTLGKNGFIQSVATAAKVITKGSLAEPQQIESVRNGLSNMYTAYDLSKTSGPKMVTLDIPMAGVGLELSAHYLKARLEILD